MSFTRTGIFPVAETKLESVDTVATSLNHVGMITSPADLKEPGDCGILSASAIVSNGNADAGDMVVMDTSGLVSLVSSGVSGLTATSISIDDGSSICVAKSDVEVLLECILASKHPVALTYTRDQWEGEFNNDFIYAIQSLGYEHSVEHTADRAMYDPSSSSEITLKGSYYVKITKDDQIKITVQVLPYHEREIIKDSPIVDFKDQLKDL